MKALKLVIDTKSLLKVVDQSTILSHFIAQQRNAFDAGKITRRISRKKLEAFAEACHMSLKRELRDCMSPKDAAVLYNHLEKAIAANRMEFIKAAWKGDRRTTLESLNS